MRGVLEAFAVIGIVLGVGFALGRTGVLGEGADSVLNRIAFHVGVPALLMVNLSQSSPQETFATPLLVSALAALVVFGLCFVVLAGLRHRDRAEATIAAWSGSYVNSGALGIPLSAYAFGNVTQVSATMLFQVVVLGPLGFAILNSAASPRPGLARHVRALVTNPIIAASVAGLGLAATGVGLEGVAAETLNLLAHLAIPVVLLAFGMSLSRRRQDSSPSNRLDVLLVVLAKTVLMPAVVFVLARWVFGVSATDVLVITVLAALPAAQNINTYASVYQCGGSLARDAISWSTLISVPVILAAVTVLD